LRLTDFGADQANPLTHKGLRRPFNSSGTPPKFGIQPKIILKNRVRKTRLDHYEKRVFADAKGMFRVEGVIPGQSYRLVFENTDGNETNQGVDVILMKPGETRDLGDLKTELPGRVN